jgi:predicted DNA-binding ribbon-helix-helix protein
MVQRTTIVMPEDLLEKLRRIADERGISFAALLREAAEEKAKGYRRPLRIIGIASIDEDLGRRSGEEPAVPEPWR